MSDKKPPAKDTPKDAKAPEGAGPQVPFPTPEAEVNARIKDLQTAIVNLQKEIRMSEGRFTNRSPEAIKGLEKENEQLRARLGRLEKALLAIMLDTYLPRRLEEEQTRYEALRLATVEYCKKANVDPEIWKNLVS